MTNRKAKNMILAVAVSVAAIFAPAWILGKWFEGIVFFVCHWLIREQYPMQYHHIVPAMCRLITGVTFFFGMSFILPFTLSLCSAIPINYFIGWLGFSKKQAEYYEYKYYKLKAKIEANKEFDADTCTEEELIARCRELKMKPQSVKLAIDMFIHKKSRKELAQEYCIETNSIKQRKRRMRKNLNNK